MTVISFFPRVEIDAGGWTAQERRQLKELYSARTQFGEVSEWADATTETGEPQFFLLGPAPACECVLSISRVDRRYIVEDGNGRVIGETPDLDEVLGMASRLRFRRARTAFAARVVLVWCAGRTFVEEKLEPIEAELVEVAEVLGHIAPQVAAFA